jgi:hypothetical protein
MNPLMTLAAAQRQDDFVDAMELRELTYDATQRFSWRSLADELAVQHGKKETSRGVPAPNS